MKKIVIIGNSANSKLARFYFDRDTEYEVVAFSVSEKYIKDKIFDGLPVYPMENLEKKFSPNEYAAFVAVGYSQMNKTREFLYNTVKEKGYDLPNYISPRCSLLSEEGLGDNNFILEDNTIQPFVKIGSNNVLWSGNHIGHDTVIGDHNFITSHVVVSGFVTIKNHCFLGVNATIRDAVTIESSTLVGAGAIIMKSTVEHGVYLPAKSMLFHKKSYELEISE